MEDGKMMEKLRTNMLLQMNLNKAHKNLPTTINIGFKFCSLKLSQSFAQVMRGQKFLNVDGGEATKTEDM